MTYTVPKSLEESGHVDMIIYSRWAAKRGLADWNCWLILQITKWNQTSNNMAHLPGIQVKFVYAGHRVIGSKSRSRSRSQEQNMFKIPIAAM